MLRSEAKMFNVVADRTLRFRNAQERHYLFDVRISSCLVTIVVFPASFGGKHNSAWFSETLIAIAIVA